MSSYISFCLCIGKLVKLKRESEVIEVEIELVSKWGNIEQFRYREDTAIIWADCKDYEIMGDFWMKEYLDKRVLLKHVREAILHVSEAKVLEISDNGNYFKCKYTSSGNIYWLPIKDFEVIDTLTDA